MPAFKLPFANRRFQPVFPGLCLLAFLTALPAAGQDIWLDSVSRYRYLEPIRMTLLLPVDGPSASVFNPARLASAEGGYADFGTWTGGKSKTYRSALGIGFRRRFYLGLFLSSSGSAFENTNAMIVNTRIGGQLAYRHPLDAQDRGSLTLGIGEATRMVNSLGVFKANSSTLDLGVLWVPSAYPGGWRLEFGWSARDLRPFSETVPDDLEGRGATTHVDYAPWMTLAGISAESPAKHWMLYGEAGAGADYEPAFHDEPLPGWGAGPFNLYLPRLGVRFRPIPIASIAFERLWNRYWAAVATLGTGSWQPLRCEAEFRAAHGPFLQYRIPDESGWSLAWNLGVHW